MARTDRPATTPREISSRSAKLSANRDRLRDGGLIPPVGYICAKMHECDLPKTRAIDFSPEPSLRRTKVSMIYRKTGNLRAVQLLLGHTKLESTVRYLGVEVDDALALSEQVDL